MFIKNNKGVSLLEVLVTMGIITVLAGIAIPAYNQYKDGVKNTVLKADVSNGRKAYLAYDAVNNTFCATLETVGLTGLGESDLYEDSDKAFAGFGFTTVINSQSGTACTQTVADLQKMQNGGLTATSCKLNSSGFFLGAGFEKGDQVGYFIGNNDSGPRASKGGVCTGYPNCRERTKCITANDACHGQTTGQTWVPGTINDLCSDS